MIPTNAYHNKFNDDDQQGMSWESILSKLEQEWENLINEWGNTIASISTTIQTN